MKIVIAPDSFKECMTAREVADAIEKGFKKVFPNAIFTKVAMADGGEGTVQSLVDATNGSLVPVKVTGPLQTQVDGYFGLLGDSRTAVIEMAVASGLHLVPEQYRNPLITTSIGTGELIKAALEYGISELIIGIGGSATNDGGAGMAYALGVRFLDETGNSFFPLAKNLHQIHTIDISGIDERLANVSVRVACDVTNPLIGPLGASTVYGPQKGATDEHIEILETNLEHYGKKIFECIKKDVTHVPGSGAAGGMGAGLLAFFNAKMCPGIEVVSDVANLEKKIIGADLVITGEGQINHQTPFGKTPVGVAAVAKKYNLPVIAIAGSYNDGYNRVFDFGIDAVFGSVPKVMNLADALLNGKKHVSETSENVARLLKITGWLNEQKRCKNEK